MNNNIIFKKVMAFSAPMVRAILEGKKTQTRRYANTFDGPPYSVGDTVCVQEDFKIGAWRENPSKIAIDYLASPEITNTPWIEPTCDWSHLEFKGLLKETKEDLFEQPVLLQSGLYRWAPGRAPTRRRAAKTMTCWLSRIVLTITNVRVENLLDITEEDAVAEGFTNTQEEYSYGMSLISAAGNFQKYWYELYGDDPIKGLEANPRVFVYEFERIL